MGLLGHTGLGDPFLEFLDLGLLIVALAELLLDGLHLLAQVELALHLLHLADSLGLDLAAQFEHFEFLGQQGGQALELAGDAVDLKDLLGHLDVQPQAGGDQIDQLARIFDV